MGKDTTTAADHPSTNALDDVDTGGTPINFKFGSRTIRLEQVPDMDETFTIQLKVQVKSDGNERNAKGELIPQRGLKIIEGWTPGQKPIKSDGQGELYPTDPVTGGPDEEDGSVVTGDGQD